MVKSTRERKCRSCRAFFSPDPRNVRHQEFCSQPECRKASKAISQRRWLSKPENKDYFKGPGHVKRVQKWRKANPGYWRRKKSCNGVLQDFLNSQHIVFIGLIAHLTGSALQDDIAMTASRLRQLGNDILNFKGEGHGSKTPHIPPQGPQSPQTV